MDGEYHTNYTNYSLTDTTQAPELFQAEGEEEDEKGETQPVAARTKHTDVYALGMVCQLSTLHAYPR